ncbi:MAG: hypothetical protein HY901_23850 [Deltaproteobacteria bacterium]|nr:hypothetical protein [Deltaproteobacteria bacterium]
MSAHLLACLAVLAWAATASPPVSGGMLPDVESKDVSGAPRRLSDLVSGKEPVLVVAITERGAAGRMRAWFDVADTRAPLVRRVSIVSIGKPFFVTDDLARSKARQQVPPAHWHATLFDSDHRMARALGLGEGDEAWAFAVDDGGKVLAFHRGSPFEPSAEEVWRALQPPGAAGE